MRAPNPALAQLPSLPVPGVLRFAGVVRILGHRAVALACSGCSRRTVLAPRLKEATPAQSGGQVAALRGQGKGSFASPQPEVTYSFVPTSQALSKEAARPQEAEKDQLVRADGPGLSRRTDPRLWRDGWHRGTVGRRR